MVRKKPRQSYPKPTLIDYSGLDAIAQKIVENGGRYDKYTFRDLADHEIEYVSSKAVSLAKQALAKKKRKTVVAKQAASEEWGRLSNSPRAGDKKLFDNQFWSLVSTSHRGKVPPMRQAIVIERWLYLVTDDDTEQRLLSQLVFWFKPLKYQPGCNIIPRVRARLIDDNADLWVAKTDEDMALEIGKPVGTIKRHRSALVRRGLIVVKYELFCGKRTCHYRIAWDALHDAFQANGGDLDMLRHVEPELRDGDEDEDDALKRPAPLRSLGEDEDE